MPATRTRTDARTPRTRTTLSATEVGSGLLVVDKASGRTSHQVVARVRRLLGTRKVGHAGTLDPMATGVLLVGVGRATRLLGQLALTDKAYDATVRLGVGTLTDDAEGEVTARPGAAGLDDDRLAEALEALRGPIAQVPTAVSAIKVNGVRAYAKVRAGEEVELAARPVTVHRLEVLGRRDLEVDETCVVDLDLTVECTTGTYVRALARDLGAALGTAGHLTALRRTRVGSFSLAEAVVLPEQDGDAPALVAMGEVARRCFPVIELTSAQAEDVRVGRRLADLPVEQLTALLDPAGDLLALYRPDGSGARAEAVFVG
jgi:tRNA pseudouridine55 synthase